MDLIFVNLSVPVNTFCLYMCMCVCVYSTIILTYFFIFDDSILAIFYIRIYGYIL